jgi:pantoate--beta-alanine ligase
MVKDLCLRVKIVVCPIVRSDSGLALSSRNQYLSEEQRDIGLTLYRGLVLGEKLFEEKADPKQLVQKVIDYIQTESRVELDYIKLNDPNTLEEITSPDQLKNGGLLSGAIRIGGVRLIDNICLGCQL